ncbi:MAG: DUF917 domain-containing protein [Chloroflexi bacterium]|nr:DUF917 domain-containing protein [Chloroflexota bacterium]
MWKITADDLESIAIGAGILGTGGGGNPYLGKVRMREHVKAGRTATIIRPEDVPDDACVVSVFNMGAPTVGYERLPQGEEEWTALRALEAHIGRKADAIVPGEIGGSNSIAPLVVGAQCGVPVIDADGMGRAFPELQMETFTFNGVSMTPLALSSHKGETVILRDIDDPHEVERVARRWAVAHGARAGTAGSVMTGAQLKAFGIPGTLTLARRVGEAVRAARNTRADIHAAVLAVTGGRRLFTGKIVDVERRTTAGFARGEVTLAADDQSRCMIAFQNENLIARAIAPDGSERVLAIVPDLICIVDSETGEPVTTELLRYGLRVTVLGIPAPVQLRTPRALEFVGPRAFGYDTDFRPLELVAGKG